jgi:ribokinase
MKGKVLVVGSLNMDLVVNAPRLPQVGETILGGAFATFPGGKGANQAVAAARMGVSVAMIGCVGRDGFGDELRQVLTQDGIDVTHISILDGQATGIALITVDVEGRNTIVVASGANAHLTPRHLLAVPEAFSSSDALVLQLESPLETVREAVRMAKRYNKRVVLNPAPAQALDVEILSQVDYFIPNEREAMQVVAAASLDEAIEKLLALGVRNLLVTLGEDGVMVVTANERRNIPALKVKAIDTVAAGDAFVGAFSAGLASGMDTDEAVRLANAAAAISVTRHGAQPSLPTGQEVREFMGSLK